MTFANTRSQLTARDGTYGQRGHLSQFSMSALLGLGWLLLAEALRELGLQGPLTVGLAASLCLFAPIILIRRQQWNGIGRAAMWVTGFLTAFLIWTLARVSGPDGFTRNGLQNVSVYVVFVLTVLFVLTSKGTIKSSALISLTRLFAAIGTIPYFVVALSGTGLGDRFIGSGSITGIASVGLVAAVVMPRTVWARLFTVAFFIVILSSLSRAYIVFALICLTVPPCNRDMGMRFFRKWFARVVVLSIGGVVLMTQYPPLRDRFVVNDGGSIAGLDIGTSGRDNLWGTVVRNISDASSAFGHGAGEVEILITRSYGVITQPHNDYLRLLFDFGIVGLVTWAVALVIAIVCFANGLLHSRDPEDCSLYLATTLLLLLVVFSSLLDNVIVYVFVMAPVAVFVGSALRTSRTQSSTVKPAISRLRLISK